MTDERREPSPNGSKTPDPPPGTNRRRLSRRKALGAIGVGAAVAGAPSLVAAAGRGEGRRGRGDGRDRRRGVEDGTTGNINEALPGEAAEPPADVDRFSRIFEDHPPFIEPSDELRIMLAELGAPGGPLDATDPLEVGPVRLITEPELSPDNPDNPFQTAGATFVGQFIDHDITSDGGSRLGEPTSVRRSTNQRSARLDLDSVYGGGPSETPQLYSEADPFLFRIESGGVFEDLPRRADGTAIIADGRNDENLMIGGLQVAFLKFHNAVYLRARASGLRGEAAFEAAQRDVRWHYQWLVLTEFLPQFVGADMVNDILANGRRHYRPQRARIPVEFQTSAYRFGHSLVRPSYRANLAGDDGEPFFGFVFDPGQFGRDDPDDLAGGSRAARRFIGWQTFFDFEDGEVKPNKRIDTKLSTPLFQLPMGSIATSRGEPIGPTSLATRNLLRHITWGIPSGQSVAATMDAPRLSSGDLADVGEVAPPLQSSTPLWLYVLREAEVMEDGLHLGPVGGRLVAEVLVGLLELDATSFLRAEPRWRPTLPSRSGSNEFRMVDLLRIAGVDPESRGQ